MHTISMDRFLTSLMHAPIEQRSLQGRKTAGLVLLRLRKNVPTAIVTIQDRQSTWDAPREHKHFQGR